MATDFWTASNELIITLRHYILCFCLIAHLQCTSKTAVTGMRTGQIFCNPDEGILKCFKF